jgi:hypothetical protein
VPESNKLTADNDRIGHGKPGPGRPRGSANRLTVSARKAFQLAFDGVGGIPALTERPRENRGDFYRIYARSIPADVRHETLTQATAVQFVIHAPAVSTDTESWLRDYGPNRPGKPLEPGRAALPAAIDSDLLPTMRLTNTTALGAHAPLPAVPGRGTVTAVRAGSASDPLAVPTRLEFEQKPQLDISAYELRPYDGPGGLGWFRRSQ